MSSSESSSRRPRSSNADSRGETLDLSTQRRSARTMGCVGFSIVAHAAFLAALAVSQEHIPEMMGNSGVELVAGAASGSEASIVSLVDTSSPTETTVETAAIAKSEPTGILTDSSSEVVISEPQKTLPEKAPPVKKAIVKAPAPAKVAKAKAPTVTPQVSPEPPQESAPETTTETTPSLTSDDEAAPVLLANPPEDSPSSDRPETESASVAEVAEELPAKTETPVEPQAETVAAKVEAQPEESPAVAEVASQPEAQPQVPTQARTAPQAEAPQMVAEKTEAVTSSGNGAGGGSGQQASAGQGSAVSGPIRNSNDLKALRGNPNPVYPARDRLGRRQGTTVVLGRISPEGRVTDIKLEKSSGSPSMDAASLQAFRNWRYQPGQEGWVRKPFEFRLVGDAMEVPSPLGKGLKR